MENVKTYSTVSLCMHPYVCVCVCLKSRISPCFNVQRRFSSEKNVIHWPRLFSLKASPQPDLHGCEAVLAVSQMACLSLTYQH